jgi:hypothetical protein
MPTQRLREEGWRALWRDTSVDMIQMQNWLSAGLPTNFIDLAVEAGATVDSRSLQFTLNTFSNIVQLPS